MKIIAALPFSGEGNFANLYGNQMVDARRSETARSVINLVVGMVEQAVADDKPVLVWASPNVLNALEDRGLSYYLVFPSTECKPEWVARASKTDSTFAKQFTLVWDTLLDDLYRRRKAYPLILGPQMLVTDVLQLQDNEIKIKD